MSSAAQRLQGLARKAMQMYHLVEEGDAVCVGVSGGKDSVALTLVLAALQRYHEKKFTVTACTLDPCFNALETDYSAVSAVFAKAGVQHHIERTNIGQLVFETRQEKNPCALCSVLRRGALHRLAQELGCNKVALGHHLDDAVQTFYMNLFCGGRLGCFSPRTELTRSNLVCIRPLVLARETDVIRAVNAERWPVVKSRCPANDVTQRAAMAAFVRQKEGEDPAFCQKTLGAIQKAGLDGWFV